MGWARAERRRREPSRGPERGLADSPGELQLAVHVPRKYRGAETRGNAARDAAADAGVPVCQSARDGRCIIRRK